MNPHVTAEGPPPAKRRSSAWSLAVLAGWLALTFSAPAVGFTAMPGEWYAALHKPSWNPPPWIFGPVWTVLYAMMAVAAWMVWRNGGWRTQWRALGCYLLQLGLNAAWSPLFFGRQRPDWALADIILLLAAIVATMLAFVRVSRPATLLFTPYLFWVCFATMLNFCLWELNR